MYHRYGRHGPHAWRERRKQRVAHAATALVPVVRIVVLSITLPVVDAERMFLVINSNNGPEEGAPGDAQIFIDATRFVNHSLQDNHVDPLQEIKIAIRNDARMLAFARFEADYDQLEEYPTEQMLKTTIRAVAANRVPSIADARRGQPAPELFVEDLRELVSLYVDTYVTAYHQCLSDKGMDIPTEQEFQIRRLARNDRRTFGNAITPSLLVAQSIIRAVEVLKPDTQNSVEHLQAVTDLAQRYGDIFTADEPRERRERPGQPGRGF